MGLRSRRNFDFHFAFERRDFNLGSERRLSKCDRYFADDVRFISREKVMRKNVDHNVQVAWLAAALPCFALACELQPLARIHAGRDFHRDLSALLHVARAVACGTRVGDCLARAATGGTGLADGEEALLKTDLAPASALCAGLGLRPWLGA